MDKIKPGDKVRIRTSGEIEIVDRVGNNFVTFKTRKGMVAISHIEKQHIIDIKDWTIDQKKDLLNANANTTALVRWKTEIGETKTAVIGGSHPTDSKEINSEKTHNCQPNIFIAGVSMWQEFVSIDLTTLDYVSIGSTIYIVNDDSAVQ